MVWFNKVSWSEGLFLRPQLFQQQERYLEQQAHLRCEPLGSLFWGFSALAIDPAALEGGSLQLLHARGVWPDGLAFDLPRMGPMPAPLRLEPAHAGQELLLALPACVAQAEDVSFEPEPPAGARYSVFDTELRDVNPFGSGPRSVQLLHMRARVLAAAELPQAWMGLPLARVGAVHADGRAQLDPQRLPVLNVLDADATLMRWLGELHAHIGQRASQLAQRLTDELRMHSGDVADYLLLQLLNGHDSRLGHALHMKRVAPERVYEQLCGLAAEMATYLRPQARRAPALPPYAHVDPGSSFVPLLRELREMLHRTVRRSAELIELQQQSHGLRVASIAPSALEDFSVLVLAAGADLAPEVFAQQFVSQAKVGPSDRLAELVRLHLPGIGLRLLPVPPRQIPFDAAQMHFQLETEGPLWQHLKEHGGIGIHMAVEFPGLRLQLWGVR